MNIAIIGTAYPFRGGLAAYKERLAKELQDQGHEVTIYTFTVQYPNFLFPGKSQYSDDPRPEHLHIVECINSVNPLNWISVGAKIRRAGHDLILIKFWLPFMGPCFGTLTRRIKKNGRTKFVAIIDNIIPHEKRFWDSSFTRYFVGAMDAFIVMSRTVLEGLKQFDTGKPRLLSPHPIYDNFGDVEPRETALEKLGLPSGDLYILFFGFIRKYKGLDLLLEAFADKRLRGSGIKLIIAGEYYADKEEYLAVIRRHALENDIIQVNDFIPDTQVAHYFNACDLVVQPYKSATQSGVTQIAYHFDKPMIVTNVGGLAEMCPDGKVGYVVEPRPREIADAILRFFTSGDRKAMAAAIAEEKKKYSWNVLTENIFSLLRRVQQESRPA